MLRLIIFILLISTLGAAQAEESSVYPGTNLSFTVDINSNEVAKVQTSIIRKHWWDDGDLEDDIDAIFNYDLYVSANAELIRNGENITCTFEEACALNTPSLEESVECPKNIAETKQWLKNKVFNCQVKLF